MDISNSSNSNKSSSNTTTAIDFCIDNKNTGLCFTHYKEYQDDYRNHNYNNNCPHSLAFNVGIRLSRKTITLRSECNFGQYNIEPICYYCKMKFNHLDYCSYFWGCIACFKMVFPKKKIDKILLCEKCTEDKCEFFESDQKTGIFKFK